MVIKTHYNHGFTLVEVLISTIVMTMMMVSVIAYIQYGSQVWQLGHTKISAENYKRMAFELIKRDLMRAESIQSPAVSSTGTTTSNSLIYRINAKSHTISIATPTEMILYRACPTDTAFNMRIARNIATFTVNRISTWTLEVLLEIQSDTPDDTGNFEILSQDKVTMMAPGAG